MHARKGGTTDRITWAVYLDRSGSMEAGHKHPHSAAANAIARRWLACAKDDEDAVPIGSLHAAHRLPRDAALLAISDWFDELNAPRLRVLGAAIDCTAIVAVDPWIDGLPLRGFWRFADLETGMARTCFLGRQQLARYAAASADRHARIVRTFRDAGWRIAPMDEGGDFGAVGRAFATPG